MKKVLTGLLVALLIFTSCRRKSSNSTIAPDQNDTDQPPNPPGDYGTTSGSSLETTTNRVGPGFNFVPLKQNLEAGNIGIIYKEDKADILSLCVNICGGNNIFGVTFDLDYDSTRLKLKSVKEGDFLKSDGKPTYFGSADSIIVATRFAPESGVTGNGTICVIELEAKDTFESLEIGFKKQTATNSRGVEILSDNNWFGGILKYK